LAGSAKERDNLQSKNDKCETDVRRLKLEKQGVELETELLTRECLEKRATIILIKLEIPSSEVQMGDLNKIGMSTEEDKLQKDVPGSEHHAKVSSSTRDDDNSHSNIDPTDESPKKERKRKLPKRCKYLNENGEIACDTCGKLFWNFLPPFFVVYKLKNCFQMYKRSSCFSGKVFTNYNACSRHSRQAHYKVTKTNVPQTFKCTTCKKEFARRDRLTAHTKSKHG